MASRSYVVCLSRPLTRGCGRLATPESIRICCDDPDERRFLHRESGATAVKGDAPVFDLPVLTVDEWRRMALEMGAVEHVKIREGKAVIDVLWWDEWKETDGKQAG